MLVVGVNNRNARDIYIYAGIYDLYHSPSKPMKPAHGRLFRHGRESIEKRYSPVRRKTGKNRFFSSVEHQFHALVRRPSIQDPACAKPSGISYLWPNQKTGDARCTARRYAPASK